MVTWIIKRLQSVCRKTAWVVQVTPARESRTSQSLNHWRSWPRVLITLRDWIILNLGRCSRRVVVIKLRWTSALKEISSKRALCISEETSFSTQISWLADKKIRFSSCWQKLEWIKIASKKPADCDKLWWRQNLWTMIFCQQCTSND